LDPLYKPPPPCADGKSEGDAKVDLNSSAENVFSEFDMTGEWAPSVDSADSAVYQG
jgi:hypothetical protein